MSELLLSLRDVEFLLFEHLKLDQLYTRERYAEYSDEIARATLETARKIAEDFFLPHYSKLDANEPTFDGQKVHMIPEVAAAWKAYADGGYLAAPHDYEDGGLQMPELLMRACSSIFFSANVSTAGYAFLTAGAANLIKAFGSAEHKATFLPPMLDGRFSGTMALTEPGQGSALADIRTTATPTDDGHYLLSGQKMFISAGDHEITDNIVHMVLAKIKGAPAGTKGISLFICPKFLVNEDGTMGVRNDVALAGLLHKMGYRGTTSTVLNFGDEGNCVGYLLGEPHKGLNYMFQMMNEARIGVGSGAAALACNGYTYSLNYAKERPQGRLPSVKYPESPQVNIIEHADVKRMLLAQKSYAEGSLALCFYASLLVDDEKTAPTDEQRREASALLDILTPIVKSWPSIYGLKANEIAIQVLGGSGYIREYPVEQFYRDNRLNPIHEGTTGIQALDLLGRKVLQNGGLSFKILMDKMHSSIERARASSLKEYGDMLHKATEVLGETTNCLIGRMGKETDLTLANATVYLDMTARIVMGWIWLDMGLSAEAASDEDFYRGKIQAMKYHFNWELPEINAQADLLQRFDPTCLDMKENWF